MFVCLVWWLVIDEVLSSTACVVATRANGVETWCAPCVWELFVRETQWGDNQALRDSKHEKWNEKVSQPLSIVRMRFYQRPSEQRTNICFKHENHVSVFH